MSESYQHVVKGGLKLKGGVPTSGGVKKKKKKKDKVKDVRWCDGTRFTEATRTTIIALTFLRNFFSRLTHRPPLPLNRRKKRTVMLRARWLSTVQSNP
jgi:hypothetical protein